MKTTRNNQIMRVFLLSGLVFFTTTLFAQESFTIKGRILNSAKAPVENAVANLLDPATMEVLGTAVCDENGVFNIENIEKGEYVLSVKKNGFAQTQSRTIIIDKYGNYTEKNVVMNNTKQNKGQLIASK